MACVLALTIATPPASAGTPRPARPAPPASRPTPAPERPKAAAAADDDLGDGTADNVVAPNARPMSLADALEMAQHSTYPVLVARERVEQAEASMRQSRAALMPSVGFVASQANSTANLKAQGLSFPGISPFVGPFDTFDARVRFTQQVFALADLRTVRAGQVGIEVAQARERAVREQVAVSAALAYVEALRSERNVAAARANLRLARTLLGIARDQRTAGVGTGVDVARAESSTAQLEVALAQANTAFERAQLQLARVTGAPLDRQLRLVDTLRASPGPIVASDAAVALALLQRPEVAAGEALLRQRSIERAAVRAERYPTIGIAADIGPSGATPSRDEYATRSIGVRLAVPLFDGGTIDAHADQAASREREADLDLRDARRQIEQDARLATAILGSAAEQVRASVVALDLARRLLRLARDRFVAGVADNLEVVDAQTNLANARYGEVAALATYSIARIDLAAAIGRAGEFRF